MCDSLILSCVSPTTFLSCHFHHLLSFNSYRTSSTVLGQSVLRLSSADAWTVTAFPSVQYLVAGVLSLEERTSRQTPATLFNMPVWSELVDAQDLGSCVQDVGVRVPLPAPHGQAFLVGHRTRCRCCLRYGSNRHGVEWVYKRCVTQAVGNIAT